MSQKTTVATPEVTTITIEYNETGMKWGIDKPTTFEMLMRVGLQFLQMTTVHAAEQYPDNKDQFFDMPNTGMSNILNELDPTITSRPNLTEVAILLAENTLLKQAEARGMTLEEYLPEAKIIQEREFDLFKRNEEGRRRHLINYPILSHTYHHIH